ncbi:MAG TPA: sulfurtransferase TusA family protein [Candidatus Polarisedimenticolaceae bacterium]|nr:sulfurtransferase TusA family protein [Candidatus Polarisedimenticolaceae bacterium]
MSDVKEDRLLDASGLSCPMPVVRAAKEMKALAAGQVLKIIATDRGSLADIPAWADDTGNELLSSATEGAAFVFFVRKGAD